MITLDTNVLVRIIIDDKEAESQVIKARNAVKQVKHAYIPQIVQIESVWVFESCYSLSKIEIISILEHLQQNQAFLLQRSTIFDAALDLYKNHAIDFADCLIGIENAEVRGTLVTFDKQFAKLKDVKLL